MAPGRTLGRRRREGGHRLHVAEDHDGHVLRLVAVRLGLSSVNVDDVLVDGFAEFTALHDKLQGFPTIVSMSARLLGRADLLIERSQARRRATLKRLLEIPEVLSVKRGEFSKSIHKHIVRTLTLLSPS